MTATNRKYRRHANGHSMSAPKVLVIGGDQQTAGHLASSLNGGVGDVVFAADVGQGIEQAASSQCDLVVVAPTLPEPDLLDVCRRIRQMHAQDPPPILLAPASETSDQGPQTADETAGSRVIEGTAALAGNIAAVLAKMRGDCPSSCISSNGIEIDRDRHLVLVGGAEVRFTPTEFRILWTLLSGPGRVFSRGQLTKTCIGENAPVHERTIDVHIKAIRQKLSGRGELIETVRGIGYRFREVTPRHPETVSETPRGETD
jgi:two-component system phosphate regulon response regulator PhoB